MSNAVLEYMAAGRAIVATRVGATGQLLRDGQDGLLIEPDNLDDLTNGMERLLAARLEPRRARRR